MKRFILLFSLLISGILPMTAAIWTPMASGSAETPLYVRVTVNGVPTTSGLEVAAFIDGDCRAAATTANYLGNSAYLLRVNGTPEDMNKTITIKAFYNNLVYVFTTTEIFDNETATHSVPIDLYLDALVGVSIVDPINVVAALPAERDLTADVTFLYDEASRQNKSNIESEFEYIWTPASGTMTMTGNVLTATAVTPPDGYDLTLKVQGPNYGSSVAKKQYSTTVSTKVIVTEPVVDVTSITLSPTSITATIGDNYLTKIAELVTVTVLPANATDASWTTSIDPSSTATLEGNVISAPGMLKVIIASASNPEVTATLTINIPTPVSFNYPADLVLSKLHATPVAFTNLTGDDFDKSLITIVFNDATSGMPCATAVMSDASGMNWNFTGQYVGTYNYRVYYDGTPMRSTTNGTAGVVHIPAEVALNNTGWDWISLYAFGAGQTSYPLTGGGGDYLAWMNLDASNKIIEIRSQSALLYNDATWGFIGDITELTPAGGMYKVKATYADAGSCVIDLGVDCVPITSTTAVYNTIQTGYTWISYPLETATTIAQTQLATNAQSGDMIIGKTTSATFNGTTWLPADFTFQPGKGYIYYTTGGGGFRPNFNAPAGGGVKGASPALHQEEKMAEPSPWTYDASPFADNMPVIAALEGLETGERFSIGAFVGDECRGEGAAIDGNLFIINVAGKAGELVHFRLYNKATAEFSDLDQSIVYTSMQGSLRAPVKLSGSGVVDGIQTTTDIPTFNDAYNLAGQKVGRGYRGIVVTNGRKVVK